MKNAEALRIAEEVINNADHVNWMDGDYTTILALVAAGVMRDGAAANSLMADRMAEVREERRIAEEARKAETVKREAAYDAAIAAGKITLGLPEK